MSVRPLRGIENLEVQRERLLELIEACAKANGDGSRLIWAVNEIERQIQALRRDPQHRAAAA